MQSEPEKRITNEDCAVLRALSKERRAEWLAATTESGLEVDAHPEFKLMVKVFNALDESDPIPLTQAEKVEVQKIVNRLERSKVAVAKSVPKIPSRL